MNKRTVFKLEFLSKRFGPAWPFIREIDGVSLRIQVRFGGHKLKIDKMQFKLLLIFEDFHRLPDTCKVRL